MTAPRLEDFYGTAGTVEVLLIGGPRDGERMTWPARSLHPALELPLPQKPFHLLTIADMEPMAADATSPAFDRMCAYRFTGSVRDDGARVYEAVPGRRRR